MKRLLIAMVKFYRKNISPWRPPCCRYIPTCSQYALEALEAQGSELILAYSAAGGDLVQAGWTAR